MPQQDLQKMISNAAAIAILGTILWFLVGPDMLNGLLDWLGAD